MRELKLEALLDAVRVDFSAKHQAREHALKLCREVIRFSALAIRALHRGELDEATGLIQEAKARLKEVGTALSDHPDVYHAGFVHDAQKEFVEATLTLAIIRGESAPMPAALGCSSAAYLNGMGEAAGELRRSALDVLRRGDVQRAERFLEAMDEIYGVLVSIDYPDAMTGGLRRTTDVVRNILEKTRGDLTVASRQYALEQRLQVFQERIEDA